MIKLRTILNEVFDTNLLEKETPTHMIFCDLDGVLVDLDKGVKQLTGGLGYGDYAKTKGHDAMWALINQGGSIWWATLPWTPNGKKLWNFIKTYKPTILSAGSKRNSGDIAIKGKKEWCFKNLGSTTDVIVTDSASGKQAYAKPNYILIDDFDRNIEEWKAAGGIGILHKDVDQTIHELNQILKK
jgi:hypothetical protein